MATACDGESTSEKRENYPVAGRDDLNGRTYSGLREQRSITFDVAQTLHENITVLLTGRKKNVAPLQVSHKEIAGFMSSTRKGSGEI